KTDKGRKLSFMRGIFISCWINHKKRKKLEGTLFGHPPLLFVFQQSLTASYFSIPSNSISNTNAENGLICPMSLEP
ncbi:hypothetical protein, partial [Bacteroides hominis]